MPWYFSCKSHWFCRLVQIHSQDVVVFILNTASPWIIPERLTAPQHTRFILPPIHPTKSSLRCVGGIFLFWEAVPWKFHEPSERDTVPWPHTFCGRAGQRRCTNRGRNFVRAKRRPHYMSRITSTYFLRLNNSETFVENAFWAQR